MLARVTELERERDRMRETLDAIESALPMDNPCYLTLDGVQWLVVDRDRLREVMRAQAKWCERLAWENRMRPHDFGWAIEQLKQGNRVARSGWNGKGMYLFLGTCSPNDVQSGAGPGIDMMGSDCRFICMKAADDSIVVGWLASQTDMLAEDWMVAEWMPRNYPVPDEIEQVLVQCCDDCPCLVVENDKLCSLMSPEIEGTDRRGRKFVVQHEITVDTSEQVDPECPLKKKHHVLMLSR